MLIKIGLLYDAILLGLIIFFSIKGWYIAAGLCALGLLVDMITLYIKRDFVRHLLFK